MLSRPLCKGSHGFSVQFFPYDLGKVVGNTSDFILILTFYHHPAEVLRTGITHQNPSLTQKNFFSTSYGLSNIGHPI